MPQRVEIRKRPRGFPQLLGKASQKQLGFPTFPTGPAAGTTKTNTKTKYTLIPIRGGRRPGWCGQAILHHRFGS